MPDKKTGRICTCEKRGEACLINKREKVSIQLIKLPITHAAEYTVVVPTRTTARMGKVDRFWTSSGGRMFSHGREFC